MICDVDILEPNVHDDRRLGVVVAARVGASHRHNNGVRYAPT